MQLRISPVSRRQCVAEGWFNAILSDIATLKRMPGRCPVASESADVGRDVRVLLHGRKHRTYKIYFAIEEAEAGGTVRVFHVRHWARAPVGGTEAEGLI